MFNLDPLLLLVAGLIILGLLAYLAWLLWRLWLHGRQQAAVQARLAESNQTQHESRRKSMEMISLAVIDGDCELAEGCIRIKHLLDYYPGLAAEPDYAVIGHMYEELKGLATHDDRRALSPRARAAEDRARYRVEERFGNDFMACMRLLHQRMLDLDGSRYDFDLR